MKNPVFPAVGDLTQIKDMTLEAFERMFPELEYFRLSQTKGFDTDYEEFYQQKTPLSRKYVGPILLNVAFERDPLVTEQALHGTEISHEMRFRVSMPQLEARKFYPSLGDVLKFTDFNPVEGEVIYEVMSPIITVNKSCAASDATENTELAKDEAGS